MLAFHTMLPLRNADNNALAADEKFTAVPCAFYTNAFFQPQCNLNKNDYTLKICSS
jgi:hypothetical protein